jgi:hypothetical protein
MSKWRDPRREFKTGGGWEGSVWKGRGAGTLPGGGECIDFSSRDRDRN